MRIRVVILDRIAISTIVFLVAACVVGFSWKAWKWNQYVRKADHITTTFDALRARRPLDVPEDQWNEAVDWTSNMIGQDFFHPERCEYEELCRMAARFDQKVAGDVDLGTLQWMWDECANAKGSPDCCAIRFRRVELLTKGPITDERLPGLWSLDRCIGLDLSGTEITDDSVAYLKTLTQLEALDITNTGITDEGSRELVSALPGCRIIR